MPNGVIRVFQQTAYPIAASSGKNDWERYRCALRNDRVVDVNDLQKAIPQGNTIRCAQVRGAERLDAESGGQDEVRLVAFVEPAHERRDSDIGGNQRAMDQQVRDRLLVPPR